MYVHGAVTFFPLMTGARTAAIEKKRGMIRWAWKNMHFLNVRSLFGQGSKTDKGKGREKNKVIGCVGVQLTHAHKQGKGREEGSLLAPTRPQHLCPETGMRKEKVTEMEWGDQVPSSSVGVRGWHRVIDPRPECRRRRKSHCLLVDNGGER